MSVITDDKEFLRQLPRPVDSTGVIVVKRRGENPVIKDLYMNQQQFMTAYQCLKRINPVFKNIGFDITEWKKIPVDG